MGAEVHVTTMGGSLALLDEARDVVELLEELGMGPSGVGRAIAMDLLVEHLLERGAAGVRVDIGCDVRVAGQGPGGGAWIVTAEHPLTAETMALALVEGAVVTASPSTCSVSHPQLAAVTVVAAEAWGAGVVARAALDAGVSEGLYLLAASGSEGFLVDVDGVAFPTDGLDAMVVRDRRVERGQRREATVHRFPIAGSR